MKVEGNKIIFEVGDSFTVEVREKDAAVVPSDQQQGPADSQQPVTEGKIGFHALAEKFNSVLLSTGHKALTESMEVYGYLKWEYGFAEKEWENPDSNFFNKKYYQDIFSFNGNDDSRRTMAFNAMQAFLLAMQLVEYVPTSGKLTNTQTELYKLAFEFGDCRKERFYGNYTFRSDLFKVREAAARIWCFCKQEYDRDQIARFRKELGGKPIPASKWSELGFKDTELKDSGERVGWRVDNIGYLINTALFIPTAPGPVVPGTCGYDQQRPYKDGQPGDQFSAATGNYFVDEDIDAYVVREYNCGAQTPLSEWNAYPLEKKLRIVNTMAVSRCTKNYMFGKKRYLRLALKDGQLPIVGGYPRYCFEECSSGDLYIEGPFADLAGICRKNIPDASMNTVEKFIDDVLTIADNCRFPTYDTNWGRKRPCGGLTRTFSARSSVNGAKENGLYSVDISCLVADTEEARKKWEAENGFVTQRPGSYPSGHSAQIYAMALVLGLMKPEMIHTYMSRAYDYSVCRVIGRAHWNSDIMYGRLFGAMIAPVIMAMDGLQDGFYATKNFVTSPVETGDWNVKLYVKNETGHDIQSTGEVRLYVSNHIGVNTYLPGAAANAGARYTFKPGENDFSALDVNCIMNGDASMDDSYNGSKITDVRFYDQRHWKNTDAGFNITLDTSDPRCDTVLKKSGATFVLKITNIGNEPEQQSDDNWKVKLCIKNTTGSNIQSTGEIRLYVQDHIGVNTYLPGAAANAGARYIFKPGENDFGSLDVRCIMNGEDHMDDSYNGQAVTDVRFYDQRHWKNTDAGFKITLDTSDPRCDTVLRKSGATYVLKISTP